MRLTDSQGARWSAVTGIPLSGAQVAKNVQANAAGETDAFIAKHEYAQPENGGD